MSYANGRRIHDADSHVMERAGWLASYADARIRPLLAPYLAEGEPGIAVLAQAERDFEARQGDSAVAAEAERSMMARKGWLGLGAFDSTERKRALDLLGFESQLLFPSLAFDQAVATSDPEVLEGGVRALNRGLGEFGQADPRLRPVGFVPQRLGPEKAIDMLEEAFAVGCHTVNVEMVAPVGTRSFSHRDYDPFWERFAERGVPMVIHVGTEGAWRKPVPSSFGNNGLSSPTHQSDAPRDAHSFLGIGFAPGLFLGALVLDGVFQRIPGLRVCVAELGAVWVPSWLRQLDHAARAFRRAQPEVAALPDPPSHTIRERCKFTPFAGEDVGWLVAQNGPELWMFSSDYPHHEGTDDPIGRFERTMSGLDRAAREAFYFRNFEALFGV